MRWSVIRTIWFREVRDQLRDRRTIAMLVLLPLLMYPALGMAMSQFGLAFLEQQTTIGISGHELLAGSGTGNAAGKSTRGLPPMVAPDQEAFREPLLKYDWPQGRSAGALRVVLGESDELLARLERGEIDAVLEFRREAVERLKSGGQARLRTRTLATPGGEKTAGAGIDREEITVWLAEGERGALAYDRLRPIIRGWEEEIVKSRVAELTDRPLTEYFVDPIVMEFPTVKGELWSRLFPFLIVMMALTGALYPAIDVCAGEKERGTMETLLISPAGRAEIVAGKFLTVWGFSAATALLHLSSMGFTAWQFSRALSQAGDVEIPLPGWPALAWCIALLVPLAAFFSAISLALAIYARSTREGQYYLLPLMLTALPLTLLSIFPGIELTNDFNERGAIYSLIPITGPALLLQALMKAKSVEQIPWLYLGPVLVPLAAYCYLALNWAAQQFNREEVLFRSADRLDLKLAFRRLFQEKRSMPSAAMAAACFAIIMLTRWFISMNASTRDPLALTAVLQVAGVAFPAVLMAVLLTRNPATALRLHAPAAAEPRPGQSNPVAWLTRQRWGWLLVAALLALSVHGPLVYVINVATQPFPGLKESLKQFEDNLLKTYFARDSLVMLFLAFAVLAPLCEELAFRGFILTGLSSRRGPRKAVLASSLLFAIAHLNAFQFLPTFILGLVLGWLATRSGSLWPGVLLHMMHNGLILVITAVLEPYRRRAADAGMEMTDLGPMGIFYSWQGLAVSAMALALLLPALYLMPSRSAMPKPTAPAEV